MNTALLVIIVPLLSTMRRESLLSFIRCSILEAQGACVVGHATISSMDSLD